MRLYHTCGTVLTIKHTVSLILASNFDLDGENITLTKHKLLDSKNLKPHISLKECKAFFCNRCQEEVRYEECKVACDDCGSFFSHEELKNIGELLFCRRCLGKNKDFSDFAIFGEKSKTKKQRDKIIEDVYTGVVRDLGMAQIVSPPGVETPSPTGIIDNLWNTSEWVTTISNTTTGTSSITGTPRR
jgi:hypothetical protein